MAIIDQLQHEARESVGKGLPFTSIMGDCVFEEVVVVASDERNSLGHSDPVLQEVNHDGQDVLRLRHEQRRGPMRRRKQSVELHDQVCRRAVVTDDPWLRGVARAALPKTFAETGFAGEVTCDVGIRHDQRNALMAFAAQYTDGMPADRAITHVEGGQIYRWMA